MKRGRRHRLEEAQRALQEARAERERTEQQSAKVEPLLARLARYRDRNHIFEAVVETLER